MILSNVSLCIILAKKQKRRGRGAGSRMGWDEGESFLKSTSNLFCLSLAKEACLGRSLFLPVDVTASNRNTPEARRAIIGMIEP